MPDLHSLWLTETLGHKDAERTKWLRYGLWMGVLPKASSDELDAVLSDKQDAAERLSLLLQANREGYFEKRPDVEEYAIRAILNGDIPVGGGNGRTLSPLVAFARILTPFSYAPAFRRQWRFGHHEIWWHFLNPESLKEAIKSPPEATDAIVQVQRMVEVFIEQAGRGVEDWGVSLEPWDSLIEECRSIWGEQWAHYALSVTASGIRSQDQSPAEYSDLLDRSQPLCRRARYARLRAGVPSWWAGQLDGAHDRLERLFVLSLLLAWGSERTLLQLGSILDGLLRNVEYAEYAKVYGLVDDVVWMTDRNFFRNWRSSFDPGVLDSLSPRSIAILCLRLRRQESAELYRRYLSDYSGDEPVIVEACLQNEVELASKDPARWRKLAEVASRAYVRSRKISERLMNVSWSREEMDVMSEEVVREIAGNAQKYPYQLVVEAEARCRQVLENSIVPVATVAERDSWFRS